MNRNLFAYRGRLVPLLVPMLMVSAYGCSATLEGQNPRPQVLPPVTPGEFTQDLRDLPRLRVWQPGEPFREVDDLRRSPPGAPGADDMYLHLIDVGAGGATLLEFSCAAVLVNAGGRSDSDVGRLVRYLTRFFEARPDLNHALEAVIVTDPRSDYARALREVAEAVHVRRYIELEPPPGSVDYDPDVQWLRDRGARADGTLTVLLVEHGDLEPVARITNDVVDAIRCEGTDPAIHVLSTAASAEYVGAANTAESGAPVVGGRVQVEFGGVSVFVPWPAGDSLSGVPVFAHDDNAWRGNVVLYAVDGGLLQTIR